MSSVNDGNAGMLTQPLSRATWNSTSYKVVIGVTGGAKFGGAQITQAGSASSGVAVPFNVTRAVTGPSETSSCQLLLLKMSCNGTDAGTPAERPKPPSTSKRPSASVRISPSGTNLPRNWPVLNAAAWFGPFSVRGPGLIWCGGELPIAAPVRPLRPGWPASVPQKRRHEPLVLASSTVHSIAASLFVISWTRLPAASKP